MFFYKLSVIGACFGVSKQVGITPPEGWLNLELGLIYNSDMKKYLKFFIIFLLLSSIPAVFFFLFPNAASNLNTGDIPSFGLATSRKSETQELQTSHYLIRLTPVQTPLKKGAQVLNLEILNRDSGSHWDGLPVIAVNNDTQVASVSVQPQQDAGFYQVKVDLMTTGAWHIQFDLKNPDEKIGMDLYVPAS